MLKRSRLPATTLHNGVIASCCALLLTEMGLKKQPKVNHKKGLPWCSIWTKLIKRYNDITLCTMRNRVKTAINCLHGQSTQALFCKVHLQMRLFCVCVCLLRQTRSVTHEQVMLCYCYCNYSKSSKSIKCEVKKYHRLGGLGYCLSSYDYKLHTCIYAVTLYQSQPMRLFRIQLKRALLHKSVVCISLEFANEMRKLHW